MFFLCNERSQKGFGTLLKGIDGAQLTRLTLLVIESQPLPQQWQLLHPVNQCNRQISSILVRMSWEHAVPQEFEWFWLLNIN